MLARLFNVQSALLSWEAWFSGLLPGQALIWAYAKYMLCASKCQTHVLLSAPEFLLRQMGLFPRENWALVVWVSERPHPGSLVKVTHLQECLSLPKELFTQGQYLSLAPGVVPWKPTQCLLTKIFFNKCHLVPHQRAAPRKQCFKSIDHWWAMFRSLDISIAALGKGPRSKL